MNNQQNEFAQLVNRAVSDSKLSHMRNVIEKELLIYNILFCNRELIKEPAELLACALNKTIKNHGAEQDRKPC